MKKEDIIGTIALVLILALLIGRLSLLFNAATTGESICCNNYNLSNDCGMRYAGVGNGEMYNCCIYTPVLTDNGYEEQIVCEGFEKEDG